jgi:tetratricopeptide (TPR) repeat protein
LQSQSAPTRQYRQGNTVQTWIITYKEIQKHDPTAAKLLLLLAFFDNQDIWYELIQNGLDYSNPPPWFFKAAVSSKLVFRTKIKALVEFSLVEIKQQEGSYTLHPVVQDWCYHIAASNDLTNQLQELAFILVGYTVPNRDTKEYARLEQRLLPHANNLIQRNIGHWLDIQPEDRLNIFGAFHCLGILYSHQGKLKEAEQMYQQALAGKEKALGPDHTSTLNTVNNLGNLYADKGKLNEAEEMYQRALAGYEKALSPNHTSTLDIVNNLGNLYSDQVCWPCNYLHMMPRLLSVSRSRKTASRVAIFGCWITVSSLKLVFINYITSSSYIVSLPLPVSITVRELREATILLA